MPQNYTILLVKNPSNISTRDQTSYYLSLKYIFEVLSILFFHLFQLYFLKKGCFNQYGLLLQSFSDIQNDAVKLHDSFSTNSIDIKHTDSKLEELNAEFKEMTNAGNTIFTANEKFSKLYDFS